MRWCAGGSTPGAYLRPPSRRSCHCHRSISVQLLALAVPAGKHACRSWAAEEEKGDEGWEEGEAHERGLCRRTAPPGAEVRQPLGLPSNDKVETVVLRRKLTDTRRQHAADEVHLAVVVGNKVVNLGHTRLADSRRSGCHEGEEHTAEGGAVHGCWRNGGRGPGESVGLAAGKDTERVPEAAPASTAVRCCRKARHATEPLPTQHPKERLKSCVCVCVWWGMDGGCAARALRLGAVVPSSGHGDRSSIAAGTAPARNRVPDTPHPRKHRRPCGQGGLCDESQANTHKHLPP